MVAESEGLTERALNDYAAAYQMGGMEGIHLMPSDLYYAHGLILTGHLDAAEKILEKLRPELTARTYSAFGYYYYKHYAELEKAKKDYPGYGRALEMYYGIKDSLTSLNHYRAIQEIETKVRLRDKEQQISRLRMEGEAQEREKRWERVFFGVALGLSIVLVLLWVGRMRKQHRIGVMQGAIDAEGRERRKIADQLHDEVGGLLSLATLNLSAALEKGTGAGAPEEKLQKTQDVLFLVSTTVRELSHRLTPLAIEKYGFVQAIQDLADTINMSGKLSVQLVIVGFGDTGRYDAAFLNELYRMLQELLHNVVKHAQAAHVLVEVVEHDQDISVVVDDDGIGFDKDSVVKGRGLETVRSKIAYFKGKVGIERKREGGTLIVIQLPIVQKV